MIDNAVQHIVQVTSLDKRKREKCEYTGSKRHERHEHRTRDDRRKRGEKGKNSERTNDVISRNVERADEY